MRIMDHGFIGVWLILVGGAPPPPAHGCRTLCSVLAWARSPGNAVRECGPAGGCQAPCVAGCARSATSVGTPGRGGQEIEGLAVSPPCVLRKSRECTPTLSEGRRRSRRAGGDGLGGPAATVSLQKRPGAVRGDRGSRRAAAPRWQPREPLGPRAECGVTARSMASHGASHFGGGGGGGQSVGTPGSNLSRSPKTQLPVMPTKNENPGSCHMPLKGSDASSGGKAPPNQNCPHEGYCGAVAPTVPPPPNAADARRGALGGAGAERRTPLPSARGAAGSGGSTEGWVTEFPKKGKWAIWIPGVKQGGGQSESVSPGPDSDSSD
eukprot:gene10481-biopygen21316